MFRPLAALLTAVVALSLALPAAAQRDAGAKARGDFSFYGHSSHSHLHGAYYHAGHYGRYLTSTPMVSPQVSSMTHTAIAHHIDQTQAHLDAMKTSLQAEGNKAGLEGVAKVNAHLDEAKQHHATLQELSKSETIDTAKSKATVDKLQSSLNKAIDEHEKLLDTIDVGTPPVRAAASGS
jgi:hypothetical protein